MLTFVLAVVTLLLTQAPVTVPDTPAGRGLNEFITSFNAGGAERRTWVTGRTTVSADAAANILEMDAEILETHGAFAIVRLPSAQPTAITAILRHAKSGAHAHLTLEASGDAPFKITNMQLRPATPEEVAGK
jgi:hypothetical protein